MSQENMEIAKRLNELLNRGEMERVFEFVTEDFVWRTPEGRLDMPRTIHGPEAARSFNAEWTEPFNDFTREVEEWIDAGDWVITVGRWIGTGTGSGARAALPRDSSALRFRDGKVVEFIMGLPDKEAAFKAAGLSE